VFESRRGRQFPCPQFRQHDSAPQRRARLRRAAHSNAGPCAVAWDEQHLFRWIDSIMRGHQFGARRAAGYRIGFGRVALRLGGVDSAPGVQRCGCVSSQRAAPCFCRSQPFTHRRQIPIRRILLPTRVLHRSRLLYPTRSERPAQLSTPPISDPAASYGIPSSRRPEI
jgi:hypothetical protein